MKSKFKSLKLDFCWLRKPVTSLRLYWVWACVEDCTRNTISLVFGKQPSDNALLGYFKIVFYLLSNK